MNEALHKRPLYLQIRDILIERINAEVWAKSDPLPNEHILAQEFRVSIGTVRKAVEILTNEHVLVRRQGRGTFIVDRNSAEYENQFDRVRHADGRQILWQFRVLDKDVATPNSEEVARLRLSGPQDEVLRVIRVRSHEGRPVKYEKISIALARMPGAAALLDAHPGLVSLSRAVHVQLGRCEEAVNIAGATTPATDIFDVPEGTPLLRLERVAHDMDGNPVEWRTADCHLGNERYICVVN